MLLDPHPAAARAAAAQSRSTIRLMFITTPSSRRSFLGKLSQHRPRGPRADRAPAYAPGPPARSSRARTWSTPLPADVLEARHGRIAQVEVAAEHDRRARRLPIAVSRPVEVRLRARLGVRLGVQVAHPPSALQAHAVHHAPLGPGAQRARAVLATASPRTRIALAPPPHDLMRSGRRSAARRERGSSQLREVSAVRAPARHARPSTAGHHGGTSCNRATSHSHAASRAAKSASTPAARRGPSGRERGSS